MGTTAVEGRAPMPRQNRVGPLGDLLATPERVTPDGSRVLFTAKLGELPNGVFVRRDDRGEGACLVWRGGLLPWTPGGYKERLACRRTAEVLVLTPRSTVAAIRAGYVPGIH